MSGPALSSPQVESARKVCARLQQACGDVRLYPADHPTVRGTMDRLVATLTSHLQLHGALILQVDEEMLFFEEEEVYSQEAGRSNLAFILFRDGIRVLSFRDGIEPGEIESFVDCLSNADQFVDEDHDLATVLWEKDLVHVEYEVVDPFLEGEGSSDDAFDQLRDTVMRRLGELTSVSAPSLEQPGTGGSAPGDEGGGGGQGADEGWTEQPDKVDPETVALTSDELQQSEWAVAHPAAPIDDFAVVLLEIIGNPAELPDGQEKVTAALVLVFQEFLANKKLDGIDLIVRQLDALEEQGRRPAGFADEILRRAATPERVGVLLEGVSSAPPEQVARIEGLLKRMSACAYPALLEILATSDDRGVRKFVLDLFRQTGAIPVEYLRPLMDDPRWYVVRNAVQLATDSGDPGLAGQLERLQRHPDERVRREVMRSLDMFGDRRSLPHLVRALQDADSSVRILAVRSLGRIGTQAQFPAVHAQVESRDFETRAPEELEAFLLTFARLGGERAVETLNKYWKRRVFGTRPLPLRLAAVLALGAIGGPEAERALAEAAQSGEAQVQRAAARTVAEAQARVRGPRS